MAMTAAIASAMSTTPTMVESLARKTSPGRKSTMPRSTYNPSSKTCARIRRARLGRGMPSGVGSGGSGAGGGGGGGGASGSGSASVTGSGVCGANGAIDAEGGGGGGGGGGETGGGGGGTASDPAGVTFELDSAIFFRRFCVRADSSARQRQGRSRRTGKGRDQLLLLNRHDVFRGSISGPSAVALGHNASVAAMMATASSSVGAGLICWLTAARFRACDAAALRALLTTCAGRQPASGVSRPGR